MKHRNSDGVKRHESTKRAVKANFAEANRMQVEDLRGFNQAKCDTPEKYFKQASLSDGTHDEFYSKHKGKEVR